MTPQKCTPLESKVIEMLLQGDDLVLAALRQQYQSAKVISRNFTGHGFYLNFEVLPEESELHLTFQIKPNFCFGDVEAWIDSLKNGAGFLLWVKNGKLDFLEGYTFDEEWPTQIDRFELKYLGGSRDWIAVRKQWETAS